MSLDRCGQLYGQLIQICDVHKGITIDSLDVLFVLADSGRNEQYSLAPVLLPDAAEIFLGGTAVVTGCCRLTIGYKDQDLYPYKRNFTPSTNPSSEVLVTSKAPRLSTLLKVTVEVCPPTMVTCCEVWGV